MMPSAMGAGAAAPSCAAPGEQHGQPETGALDEAILATAFA